MDKESERLGWLKGLNFLIYEGVCVVAVLALGVATLIATVPDTYMQHIEALLE